VAGLLVTTEAMVAEKPEKKGADGYCRRAAAAWAETMGLLSLTVSRCYGKGRGAISGLFFCYAHDNECDGRSP